jgi:hypothetical protein
VAISYSLPAIWSELVAKQLEKELVFASPVVCNHDYEGVIADFGSSVKIHGVNDPTIAAYTQDTSMGSPQVLSDFEKILTINQADSFNFAIDDVQTKQMLPKLMPQALQRAAYKLANKADQYVAAQLFAAAGNSATDTNFTSTSVLGSTAAPTAISPAAFADPTAGEAAYEFLVDLGVDLDNVAVPREYRYVIVPPWFAGMLSKDLRFTGYAGYGQGTVLTDGFATQPGRNGLVGSVAGFNVVASLNVPTGSFTTPTSSSPYLGADGSSQTYWEIVAGVPSAATFAHQILKTEAFRNPTYFADQVRGLHVYGFEVVWPERIVGAYIAQGVAATH